MRSAVLACAAVALLGLTGCEKIAQPIGTGSSSTQATATPSTPPSATGGPSTAKTYDCTALLSNAEAKTATGLNFTLLESTNGPADPFEGYTDCGYFAGDGTYMQATVWTGPAYQQGFLPLVESGRATAEQVNGVGDEAGWSPVATTLGVRVGSTGVTIAYELFGGPGPANMKGSAVNLAKIVISHL